MKPPIGKARVATNQRSGSDLRTVGMMVPLSGMESSRLPTLGQLGAWVRRPTRSALTFHRWAVVALS